MANDIIASMVLAIWLYLIARRAAGSGGARRDGEAVAPPDAWPSVAAIVPARNEAEWSAQTLASLLRQDYPGALSVILVDDQSHDGTRRSRGTPRSHRRRRAAHRIAGAAAPPGWTGKLWARARASKAPMAACRRRIISS